MAIPAGLHDNGVGDREEEEQEDLGERGDAEVGDDGEGAGHAGQQAVRHVGAGPVRRRAVGEPEGVGGDRVLHRAAGVCPDSPPGDASHLEDGEETNEDGVGYMLDLIYSTSKKNLVLTR